MDSDPWTNFLSWEQASRDTIDFKTIYVDMAHDLVAGLLLSQIVYWYLPSKKGGSKLRVFKDGYYWIAKARHDWWDEIRVKTRQIDRAIVILQQKGIIVTRLYRFNNAPTSHIRIDKKGFLAAWDAALARFDETVKSETPSDPFSPNLQMDFTDPSSGFDETVKSDLPESVQSLTETTIDLSETTAENTSDFPEKDPVVEAIIKQTETHPGPEDLARATEKKQAEAGNYADPAQAGGSDAAAEAALLALYHELDSEPPRQGTASWKDELEIMSQTLRSRGVTDPDVAREAARRFGKANQETPQFANPHLSTFPAAFGMIVGRVKKKVREQTEIRRQPENALLSQEALRERQGSQSPPPQDDIVGQSIKDLLQAYVTRPTFVQYVSRCRFTCDDGALVIIAPDVFIRDWLENRLAVTIKRALTGVTDGPGEVRFEVSDASLLSI